MKGVKNYLKNVAKSATYYATDIAKDTLMPNVGEFAQTNNEFLKTAYQTLRNPTTAAKNVIDQITSSKIYEAIDYGAKNAFDDIRTGNFYNKERKDRDESSFALNTSDWNDFSEFGIDDDWESNLDSDKDKDEVTAGDAKIVEAIEGSNKAVASTTANAIIASANATIKNERASTGLLYQQNEKMYSLMHNNMSILNATMNTILKLQTATFQNIDTNMSNYFTESLKIQTENNAILKKMLELQTNQYKTAQELEEENRKDKKSSKRYSDISSGGIPDLAEYFENIQNNIFKKIKETASLPDFSGDGGAGDFIKELLVNPLEYVFKPLIESAIPDVVKKSTQELDKTISGLFGQAIGRLANAKSDDSDSILGKIADFIGVRTSVNSKIDTGKYHKGAVPFDGVTRKAITEVIPAHLRRIEAAVSGRPEMMFDYDTGKWISPKDIKRDYDNIRKNSVKRATSDLREGMDKYVKSTRDSIGIKGIDAQKEFDKALDEFQDFLYERNGIFNPAKSAEENKVDSKYTYFKKYYNQIVRVYSNFDIDKNSTGKKARHTNLSSRINLANNILQAKDSEESQYRSLEKGLNKFVQYFSNGGNFDANGKWTGEDKNKWKASSMGLLAAVDDKGNNVFNYLQNISKELEWQRNFMSITGGGSYAPAPSARNIILTPNDNNIKIPDFDKLEIKNFNKKTTGSNNLNKDDKALKDAIKMIAEGDAVNWEEYTGDESDKKLLEEFEYILQRQSIEDQIKIKNAARDKNFITRIVNKKYETNKDAKKLDELIEDTIKEEKDNETESEKTESVFSRIFGQAKKAKDFFSGIVQAPGEIFADVLYSADRAIYDMLFKNAIKAEGEEDADEYNGFMEMLVGKTTKTFEKLTDGLKENVIEPLKEKFGIGDDFGDKTKDAIKDLGTNIMGHVIKANMDVYRPGLDYLNEKFGIDKKINSAQEQLYKLSPNYKMKFKSGSRSLSQNELREKFKNKEDKQNKINEYNTDARLDGRLSYGAIKHNSVKAASNRTSGALIIQQAKRMGLPIDNEQDLTAVLLGEKEFIGPDYTRTKKAFFKPEELDKIRENCFTKDGKFDELAFFTAVSKRFLRDYNANHAKGTITSIPFKGSTMLSKGEMLFNSKGIGVVKKTDAYNISEPTHILSSYDSNPLLKSMGMNPGARRTPEQDLRSENNLKDKLFGKGSGISNHAEGSVKFENNSGIDYNLIKENIKQYAPEGIAGGIVGGIVSTLFGVVGGPLVGAAVGAAGNILANSTSLKDKLFGPLAEDNKRHGGIIGKETMAAINKYVPDTLKYGLAGIIPGLITPLGPLGGILVGGAIGFLKNNEAFTNKYFGEDGKLTFDTKTKKIIDDLMPGAAKGAAVGAAATLFGGPFGILGNAALGAGVGMLVSTEDFKDAILGKEINGVRSGGLVGELKELVNPLKDAGKTLWEKLVKAVDDSIIDPLSRFLTPAIHELPHLLGIIPRFISDTIANKVFSEDNPIGKAVRKVADPAIGAVKKVGGFAIDTASRLNPFRLVGVAGDSIRKRQIKGLRADYMTAEERNNFMEGKKAGSSTEFDLTLANIGKEGGMSVEKAKEKIKDMQKLRDSSRDLDKALTAQQKSITKLIKDYAKPNGVKFTKASQEKLIEFIKKNDINGFTLFLESALLTDGSTLTPEERTTFLNGSEDGKNSVYKTFKSLKDLEARKKQVGSYGGKSKGEYFDKLREDIAKEFGTDAASKIKNYRDLDKLITNLETEVQDREKDDKYKYVSPELEEEQKQTDLLGEIVKILKGEESTEKIDKANNKTEESIEKATSNSEKRNERDRAIRERNLRNQLGDQEYELLDDEAREQLLNGSNPELYRESTRKRDRAVHAVSRFFRDKVPTAASAKFNNAVDAVSNIGNSLRHGIRNIDLTLNNAAEKGVRGVENLADNTKTFVNGTATRISSFGARLNTAHSIDDLANADSELKNTSVASKLQKYRFGDGTALAISSLNNTKAEMLLKALNTNSMNILLKYKLFNPLTKEDIKALTDSKNNKLFIINSRTIVKVINSVEKPYKYKIAEMFKTVDSILNTSVTDILNIAENINKEVVSGDVVNDTEESPNVENINTQAIPATNGLGTFLLKGASAIGKGITGAAKGVGKGISSLFGSGDKKSGPGLGGLLGLMNSPYTKNESDEDDIEMNGRNVVREDGRSMKMKEDSDGSLVPDTSDATTKQTLNLIALKEKAQEKLHNAQLKASETINKIFDPPEGKSKKRNWLAVAIAGAALVKSGMLKTVFDKVIAPVWDKKIKPWIDGTAVPWIQNTAIPTVTGAIQKVVDALPNIGDKIVEELPKIVDAIGNIGSSIFGWITDHAVEVGSAMGEAAGTMLETLWKNRGKLFKGVCAFLEKLFGYDTDNSGTSRNGNTEDIKDDTKFYDKNGNELTKEQAIKAGKVFNENGDSITFNDDGTYYLEDGSDPTADTKKKAANSVAHVAANKALGLSVINKKSLNAANKLNKFLVKRGGLAGKIVGTGGKIIMAPANAANAIANGTVKEKVGNAINKVKSSKITNYFSTTSEYDKLMTKGKEAGEIVFDNANGWVDKEGNRVVSKTAFKESNKGKGLIAKMTSKNGVKVANDKLTIGGKANKAIKTAAKAGKDKLSTLIKNIPDVISEFLNNKTIGKKLKKVAEFLHVDDVAGWIANFKKKVTGIFKDAVKKGAKKAGESAIKEAAGKALKVVAKAFGIVTVIADFTSGMDKAESILGVQDTTILEEFACGLVNIVGNFLIIPAIFPGINKLARLIVGLFDDTLAERQAKAEKEKDEYNDKHGENLTLEEYLEQEKSVTGKVKSGFKKAKNAVKNGANKAKNAIKNGTKKAKNKVTDFFKDTKEKSIDLGAGIGSDVKKIFEYAKSGEIKKFKDFNGSGDESTVSGKSQNAVVKTIKTLMTPTVGIASAIKIVSDSVKGVISEFSTIKDNTSNLFKYARSGEFDKFKSYEKEKTKKTGLVSAVNSVVSGITKILLTPMAMITGIFKKVKDWLGNIKEWFSEKFSGIKEFLSNPIDYIYKKLTGKDDEENEDGEKKTTLKEKATNVVNTVKTGAKNVVSKVKNTVKNGAKKVKNFFFGESKYGMAKQIDPSIANIRFNAPGDTSYQTIGDSGCGPAAAVTAVQSMYGRSVNPTVQAANFAIKRGYKEKDGGTRPEFFKDYFNSNGLGSTTYTNKSDIESSIRSGNPTVLMGQDKGGVNSSNPYGKNPHYVTATGVDGKGNVIIQDPESKYNNQLYKMKNVLNKSSIGVSAYGRSKNYVRTSRFGRGKVEATSDGLLKGKTITPPKGKGKVKTYMGWQCITSPTSVQYKLREKAGQRFDSDGYGVINGRYTIACTTTYGQVGDYVDFYLDDGTVIPAVIADIKSQNDSGCNKWGHLNGDCIVEFVVDKMSWYSKDKGGNASKMHDNPGNPGNHPEWGNNQKAVVKAVNGGSYFDDPSFTSAATSGDVSSVVSATDTTDDSNESSSATESINGITGIISNMISNSTAQKALDLFTGATSSSTSTAESGDTTSNNSTGEAVGGDAAKVINIASNEVGYKEKASNKDLDSKTANAGSNNWTKYGAWYGLNGGSKAPWCAMFSSWVADQAGIPKDVIPKDAYTVTQYNKIVKSGSAVKPAKSQTGDYIYFTNNGSPSGIYHVGIVEDNENGKIRTIEGNSSQQVARRTYDKGDYGRIKIARPNYADKTATTINRDASQYSDTKTENALGGNPNKPISKYGRYRDTLRKSDAASKPERINLRGSGSKGYMIEKFDPDKVPEYYATTPQYGTGKESNNTKLIETIIDILMTIADNTDKLNNIVSILNDKLGIDVSKELNNKGVSKDTKKRKLRNSLMNQTQANSDIDTESINYILNSMNALASE